MKRISLYIILAAVIAVFMQGCIKNDIPYARIQQNILTLEAAGQEKDALIDSTEMSAVVYLDETVDIEGVTFREFSFTQGAEVDPNLLEGKYDMRKPLTVNLFRYYNYQWTITAVQNIERYFEIRGQIGDTEIDVDNLTVTVSVPESVDLSSLELMKVKLGPAGITTMTPALAPGTIDLSSPLKVAVVCHGREQVWTITALKTRLLVNTTSADAWSKVVWVYGEGPADAKNGFQYKEHDADQWTAVPDKYVTSNQGTFYCYIPGLTPLTTYDVRAVSGSNIGNELYVTTQATADIPDGDFDQWWQNGRIWCPWNKDGERFWDTGNTGAATLGQSNVVPTDYTPTGSGQAAELNTKFVGIGILGKLGAGSIFTGKFAKVDGTNGILDFGRPWTLRPTKLRGYYRYRTAPINYASSEFSSLKGRPDSCHIYVALTDWTAPYQIRTNPNNRNLFDKNASYVIAYGELIRGDSMEEYEEFEIVLDYRSTSKVPTYLQITCAASKYGDFFTGGAGATLWVDQFSFGWDY